MLLRTKSQSSARSLMLARGRTLGRATGAGALSMALFSVALDATAAETEAPKWQQVALEGEYKGYGDGERPFVFDKAKFDALVQNFRKHPSYLAGADGVGASDVVPWDFSHASEYPPFMGELPTSGAPAQGWVLELKVEVNESGKASLWALTRWLELARAYIKAGQYKWASVAVNLEAKDAVSGEALGPVLTSIAMTNSPFIEGMLELAAERRVSPGRRLEHVPGREERTLSSYYYSAASTPEEAIGCLRTLFGLPITAGVEDVSGQLDKLAGMAQGTVPTDDSIELDDIVGAVRQILGLGPLTTTPEVVTKARELIAGLATPETPGVSASSSTNPDAVRLGDQDAMDLLKILAGKLSTKETIEAVLAEVDKLSKFRETVATKLEKPQAADAIVLTDFVTLADESSDLKAKLEAMAKALGVADPAMAVQKLTETLANAAKLVEIMPELESLRAQNKELEEEQEMMDVAAARDVHFGGDEKVVALLTLGRKQLGREEFLKQYPLPEPDRAHLTQDLSGGPAGGAGSGAPPATRTAPGTRVHASRRAPGHVTPRTGNAGPAAQPAPDAVDVSDQIGRNFTEKVMAHVKATIAGADKWDHEQVWTRACQLQQQRKVFMRPDAPRD